MIKVYFIKISVSLFFSVKNRYSGFSKSIFVFPNQEQIIVKFKRDTIFSETLNNNIEENTGLKKIVFIECLNVPL